VPCFVQVIAGDPDKDVAVLQLQMPHEKMRELKPITLGSSGNLFVGQKVFAIGNPFGLDHTLTQGIISGLGRELAVPGGSWKGLQNWCMLTFCRLSVHGAFWIRYGLTE
jgi:S1-C subfamily serine protease